MSVHIEVLGPGCFNCLRLLEHTRRAVDELRLDARVEPVHDLERMLGYGVMASPALVVDGQVVFAGVVPSVATMKELLAARPVEAGPAGGGGA